MRILVIEDDPKLAAFVTGGLKQAGFAVNQPPTVSTASPSPGRGTTPPRSST